MIKERKCFIFEQNSVFFERKCLIFERKSVILERKCVIFGGFLLVLF